MPCRRVSVRVWVYRVRKLRNVAGSPDQKVAQTGIAGMPQPGERVVGGHAVVAVGYDDAQKSVIVRHSWGSTWGMKGYFTMPYAYVSDRNLSDDFWTIRRDEQM